MAMATPTHESTRNDVAHRPPAANIAVIGAGVVGTCCAAELVDRGYTVSVFDRGDPGWEGASRGNAGQVIPSLIQPVAYPGIVRDIPRLLLSPDSPFSIASTHIPRLVPWLWRFLLASRRRRHHQGVARLAELNAGALEATRDLYHRAGLSHSLKNTGALYLYETSASLHKARADWDIKGAHGYTHEFIDPQELSRLEADLSPVFAGAVFEQGVWHVSDPLRIVEGIHRYAVDRAAVFHRQEARIAELSSECIFVESGDGTRRPFDAVVIAAGAWSRQLLNQIGDDAPLESERGYNITIERPNVDIRHCLIFADRGIVATPLEPGLRIGGCVELAGLKTPANPARFKHIAAIAKKLISGLDDSGGHTWMGHRPALPDSVPIIRRSGIDERIIYAFGHGHLGLTQAPITAQRVAGLLDIA